MTNIGNHVVHVVFLPFCFVKLNLLLYVYFKKVVEQRNIAQFVMHILFFIQSLPTICWCMVTVVVANQICDKEGP